MYAVLACACLVLLVFAGSAGAADSSSARNGGAVFVPPPPPPKKAKIVNGLAVAPAGAPDRIKRVIAAGNLLIGKPYVYGGGHRAFSSALDSGYDCSGTVSFALHGAGLLTSPLPSSDLMRYGERGRGRWMTIYSRNGHTFAVIAGLRLDTTDLGRGGDVGPRWYIYGRDTSGFIARHPAAL
jgi:hypothetical protein